MYASFSSDEIFFSDSGSADNEAIEDAICKSPLRYDGYQICPHTAVAMAYHHKHKDEKSEIIKMTNTNSLSFFSSYTAIVSTASPTKFPEALEASGVKAEKSERVEALFKMPTYSDGMAANEDWTEKLTRKIESISRKRS